MGQRHQVFLIARIRPHGTPPDHPGNHRCVAAFHHQWCYGRLPLSATRRFITLVTQPENASIIRAELREIDGKYGSYEAEEPCIPDVPCPFTASLLGAAWTTNLDSEEDFYASGVSLQNNALEASMGCWGGDNNDGITVIDISEPEIPSYCFLTYQTPLNARGYLDDYYSDELKHISHQIMGPERVYTDGAENTDHEQEDEDIDHGSDDDEELQKSLLKSMNDLADIPILSAGLLREAWPDVIFKDVEYTTPTSQLLAPTLERSPLATLATLTDVALDVAVKYSIESDDTTELEGLAWLPGKAERIMAIFRGLRPFPDNALSLLVAVLSQTLKKEKTTRVDLSGFPISGHQILEILPSLPEGVECLDISYNTAIVTDDIPDVVASSPPSLRRLVLMGCPAVEDAHLIELVCAQSSCFKMLEGIIHPAFFTIEKPSPYPHVFAFVLSQSTARWGVNYVSLPFFTPIRILHALLNILPSPNAPRYPHRSEMSYRLNTPMLAISALQGMPRKPGQKFGERIVVTVPAGLQCFPHDQPEIWTFAFEVKDYDHDLNVYAFVHYKKDVLAVDTRDAAAAEPQNRKLVDEPIYADDYDVRRRHEYPGYTSQSYDLQGFLKCMAEEGRPMPGDDVVKEVQGRLSAIFSDGLFA